MKVTVLVHSYDSTKDPQIEVFTDDDKATGEKKAYAFGAVLVKEEFEDAVPKKKRYKEAVEKAISESDDEALVSAYNEYSDGDGRITIDTREAK